MRQYFALPQRFWGAGLWATSRLWPLLAMALAGCFAFSGCLDDNDLADAKPHVEEVAPTDASSPTSNSEKLADPVTDTVAEAASDAAPPPAEGSVATFGSGCFWCTEAVFERMDGVLDAVSGYMGGQVDNPSYKMVCTGITGHAEVVQVKYDPAKVSYEELLEVFWKTHDPTTLNQQGADRGTQYRSAVFYHNDSQRESAEYYRKKLDEADAFGRPIVTEITEASKFFMAEEEHQDYYALNPGAGYCQVVIAPKIEKFEKAFGEKLK